MKIQVVEKILGNIHREAIPAWTAKRQKVMAKVGEISLLDLAQAKLSPLEDLWLGMMRAFIGAMRFWF